MNKYFWSSTLLVLLFLFSCSKKEIEPPTIEEMDPNVIAALADIDISSSNNGVVLVPSGLPEPLSTLFTNYTKVVAPNGKPIHIFATSGVSQTQIVRARNILEYILRDAPGTEYGSDKTAVANAMGDNGATLVYFDTEAQTFASIEALTPLLSLGLGFQDLYATESPIEGTVDYLNNITRDAGYEEIFHLVHDYGVIPAIPAFDEEIKAADIAGTAAGIYNYNDTDSHYEYIISALDVYFGLWAHETGSSFGGEYTPTTRENLLSIDPIGYGLVEKFFLPYLDWNIQLDESFTGTFSLTLDPNDTYTLKSRYMKDVSLTGSNHSNLTGNELDNRFTGNAGDNVLNGMGGNNTVVYPKAESAYEVTENSDGSKTVVGDGTDTLININTILFN